MPKPVYIICSESGVVDRLTNLVSIFNILETIKVTKETTPLLEPGTIQLLTIHAIAVWMRESSDSSEDEYEYQLAIQLPGSQQESVMMAGKFQFNKPFHRFTAIARGRPFNQSGTCLVRSRIRKVGDQSEWLSQEYPILVEVNQLECDPGSGHSQDSSLGVDPPNPQP